MRLVSNQYGNTTNAQKGDQPMEKEAQIGKTNLQLVLSQRAWAEPLGQETNLTIADHVGHRSKGDQPLTNLLEGAHCTKRGVQKVF